MHVRRIAQLRISMLLQRVVHEQPHLARRQPLRVQNHCRLRLVLLNCVDRDAAHALRSHISLTYGCEQHTPTQRPNTLPSFEGEWQWQWQ